MTAPTKPDLSTITVDQVRDQLIQITYDVADALGVKPGELHYQDVARRLGIGATSCVNVHDRQPACLIGQWFVRHAGIPADGFGAHVASGSDTVVRHLTNIPADGPAATFLGEVQSLQDNGHLWLKAIQGGYETTRARFPA